MRRLAPPRALRIHLPVGCAATGCGLETGFANVNTDSGASADLPPWDRDGSLQPFVTDSVRAVANALFARIAAGKHGFGSRLPAERHIGGEFGVSRTIVRKAFELLQAYGVISRQQGRSRFVTYRAGGPETDQNGEARPADTGFSIRDLNEIAEITSPLELNVVRTIVEPEIVRLATINMPARDMAKLRRIVDAMSAVTTGAAEFARLDEQFHLVLAEGTNNTLLKVIYRLINNVRCHAHWSATREKTLSPNRIRDYQKLYRSICAALEARDIESGVEFVKLLMVEVQRDLMLDG